MTVIPRVVIAGATSGVGKTTVASGIMAALTRRGLKVQPFKAGPDYIDPSYHSRATGIPSRNLDTWMLPTPALLELFERATSAASVAIVEGVMGLFDGRTGRDEEGSTAHLAKILNAPVILVLDVAKMARSAGAMALGYQRFDPDLRVAGFILNRVAGSSHLAMVREAVEGTTGLPVLGHLPRREDLDLPERHLGLIPTAEGSVLDDFFQRLAGQVEGSIDLEALLAVATNAGHLPTHPSGLFRRGDAAREVRIAVAMDEAFSFYYQDNLDLMAAWGAEIVPFSPLRDGGLPEGCSGVYIGGGFPELYAARLAANSGMRQALRRAAGDDMPIYAECGGLMYLMEGIVDFEGSFHSMVGLVPGHSTMQRKRARLGYVTVAARGDSFLLRRGQAVRGHEFHWSEPEKPPERETGAYEIVEQGGRIEGYARGNILASYVHLHFGSHPDLARNFVTACAG